jgi:hypothetical protein
MNDNDSLKEAMVMIQKKFIALNGKVESLGKEKTRLEHRLVKFQASAGDAD